MLPREFQIIRAAMPKFERRVGNKMHGRVTLTPMMIRRRALTWVVLLSVCLSNCVFPGEVAGEKIAIDSEVYFRNDDWTPAANEQVYIVEQIGYGHVTVVDRTDRNGRVTLRGRYCTPTAVAGNGGAVVIRKDNLKETYVVVLTPDRTPALETIYGAAESDLSSFREPGAFEGCGA